MTQAARFDLAEKMHPESLVEDRKEPKLVLTRHFQAHIMEMRDRKSVV